MAALQLRTPANRFNRATISSGAGERAMLYQSMARPNPTDRGVGGSGVVSGDNNGLSAI
jgi:hypothetical protein